MALLATLIHPSDARIRDVTSHDPEASTRAVRENPHKLNTQCLTRVGHAFEMTALVLLFAALNACHGSVAGRNTPAPLSPVLEISTRSLAGDRLREARKWWLTPIGQVPTFPSLRNTDLALPDAMSMTGIM